MVAAAKGHTEVVRKLLELGANPNHQKLVSFFTPINVILTVALQEGYTPVFAASMKGHTDVVDLLVQAGADIHQANTEVMDNR